MLIAHVRTVWLARDALVEAIESAIVESVHLEHHFGRAVTLNRRRIIGARNQPLGPVTHILAGGALAPLENSFEQVKIDMDRVNALGRSFRF